MAREAVCLWVCVVFGWGDCFGCLTALPPSSSSYISYEGQKSEWNGHFSFLRRSTGVACLVPS